MTASVTIAERCSTVAESKHRDQCSARDHNASRGTVACKRTSLQRFPCLHFLTGGNIGFNVCCEGGRRLGQALVSVFGLVVCAVGSGIGLVDWKWFLLLEDGKNSGPAGFSGLSAGSLLTPMTLKPQNPSTSLAYKTGPTGVGCVSRFQAFLGWRFTQAPRCSSVREVWYGSNRFWIALAWVMREPSATAVTRNDSHPAVVAAAFMKDNCHEGRNF